MRWIPVFLMCATHAAAQIAVNVQILPDPTILPSPIDPTVLGSIAANQGVTGFSGVISQTVDTQLVAELCTPGTYSAVVPGTGQVCLSCPAGTASPTSGASDPSACRSCPTGTYALTGASACTDCPVNTFSVTPMAATPAACLACPNNTTSPARSDSIDKCVCVNGFFNSQNLMDATPYDAIPLALPFGNVASINSAHVTC